VQGCDLQESLTRISENCNGAQHRKLAGNEAALTRRTECVKLYVMNTKLTLRMDAAIVRKAKSHAARRGKSVSQMFSEFVTSLEAAKDRRDLPPLTSSLLGVMGDARVSEEDYKKHLLEKFL
jgi:hypothetical protein